MEGQTSKAYFKTRFNNSWKRPKPEEVKIPSYLGRGLETEKYFAKLTDESWQVMLQEIWRPNQTRTGKSQQSPQNKGYSYRRQPR